MLGDVVIARSPPQADDVAISLVTPANTSRTSPLPRGSRREKIGVNDGIGDRRIGVQEDGIGDRRSLAMTARYKRLSQKV